MVAKFQKAVATDAATIFLWVQPLHASNTRDFKLSAASPKTHFINKNKCGLSDYRDKGMFDIPFLFIWAEWLEYNFGPVKLMKNPDNSHKYFQKKLKKEFK